MKEYNIMELLLKGFESGSLLPPGVRAKNPCRGSLLTRLGAKHSARRDCGIHSESPCFGIDHRRHRIEITITAYGA